MYAQAYINLRLSSLALFYAWAYANRYCLKNPIIEYKKEKLHTKPFPKKKTKFINEVIVLTLEEQQSLLNLEHGDAFTTIRNKCIITLILAAALYADEVIHLSPTDLNLVEGCINISKQYHPKRIIPIDTKARKTCQDWLTLRTNLLQKYKSPYLFITNRVKPIAKRILYKIIAESMNAAGINKPHLGPEVLRQTAIANMLMSGRTIEEVQALTKIKTLKNIQKYQDIFF